MLARTTVCPYAARAMERRASKTAYFLNRALGYLALIGRNVRLPELSGVWVLVADAERAPWEVTDLLVASYPGVDANRLPFVALLTDFDVDEFERELRTTAPPAVQTAATETEADEAEDGEPVLVPGTTR